jgi:hypothetical protein
VLLAPKNPSLLVRRYPQMRRILVSNGKSTSIRRRPPRAHFETRTFGLQSPARSAATVRISP